MKKNRSAQKLEVALDLVKERYREHLRERQPEKIAELDDRVASLLSKQILDRRHPQYGGWGDITDAASPALAWDGTSLPQLRDLALAWGYAASRHHKDTELARRISLAARFYAGVLTPPEPFPNNWWCWQIGMPRDLTRLFLFGDGALDAGARRALLAAFRYMSDKIWDYHASANRIGTAVSLLGYGLASGDAAYLKTAKVWTEMSSEIVKDHLRDPQGFRRDGTYFYHGSRVNLSYGTSHLYEFALMTHLLAGTPWRIGGRGLVNCIRTILDFAQWTVVRRNVDPFILDRGIALPGGETRQIAAWLLDIGLFLAEAKAPRLRELQAFCARLLADGVRPTSPVTEEIARAHDGKPAAELCGTRYYGDAEYGVARRPGWCASVKMATWRTAAYAGINRLNRKGWHISDGQFILRKTGDEFDESVFPTMDWDRLSGITRADGFRIPHECMGHSGFSAGAVAADGLTGCCGLDFAIRRPDDQCEIAARKNWFFLEDAVVATGSNIWTTAAVNMETVIRHVVLPPDLEQANFEEGEFEAEFVAGHDCVYLLPDKPRIKVYTEWRAGNYGEIGNASDAARSYRRRYWTALIPHTPAGPHKCWGDPQTDSQYTIVYLPGMTLAAARAWWAGRPFEIIQKDILAHRLYDRRRNQTMTVRQWQGAAVERGYPKR